ncbi:BatA domain-containing protein [Anatilimnocola sp. NA78]|uniref:BatA domain-containing protein n=1 Tax=Anatilimnocola sp. NA78 TaxID=3415683 RepID=UPI003CE573AA
MGILAPLFLAGLAGLALPLIFHLVRRTPRGKQQFSSLMFLAPTPPRLTRRSRLDQVLLLLMRLAALALLAFAFARPFLRESSLLSITDLPQRRVALVIDTSASMQRGDLWQQAIAAAQKELAGLAPHDEVALYTFADRVQTIVGFATPDKTSTVPPAQIVRQSLADLQPTWSAGDLGSALAAIASELDAATDVNQKQALAQLVVISDFQRGSKLDSLQGFEWPDKIRVVTKPVSLQQNSNATLQLLASDEEDTETEPRVRVVNAADSTKDQFFVHWHNPQQPKATEGEVAVYVPPGQSRVVKLPRPMNNLLADRVVLRGDATSFDNAFYVVPLRQQQIALVYWGSDAADDPQGLQYYLRLATDGDPLRQVAIDATSADDAALSPASLPQIVVVSKATTAKQQQELKTFVAEGGSLVLVPPDQAATVAMKEFFPDLAFGKEPEQRGENDFQILGEIDFSHPLFVPFANPRYNDFTRIHFWRHRPVSVHTEDQKAEPSTRVFASFDNGDAWLLERSLGKGRVWAFTSGWQPEESQLAVSSKFLPLIGSLLDQAAGGTASLAGTIVNGPVALPANRENDVQIQTPAGHRVSVEPAETQFRETATPGIYQAGSGKEEFRFAVNLAASESDTVPLATEQLEQLGLKLEKSVSAADRLSRQRQERDTELECRQQVWRWLIVGCLSFVILETWWAGRTSRAAAIAPEAVA